ncbi:oligopeptide transport system permease protein OppB [Rhodopirellula maiorica SM1]|uniref:Oligopeptide transport system permease protein OppB n=1 Tax=Rhodopirellula maiorica SM1 TaxID=1265738 RepID=M5RKY4_9BACT|nr:ABC transporter permease [Rhodopirellula maiorica]EMI19836.1 oligopeptide transport system permease protein OppB [Rhodopirellula maiorica SM1]
MRDLLSYIIKRFGWMLITLWIVYSVSFVLMRSVPGNPFSSERNVPPAIERQLKARYNLDAPPIEQYVDYLVGIVTRFDLGWCIRLEDYSVNQVLAEGFPVSASLAIFALVFAIVLGVSAGVVSAVYRGSFADVSMMAAAVLGIAIPNFVLASLAILLFVFGIQLFPAGGWGTLRQVALPALCLGAPVAAYIARLTRAGMLEVMTRDHVRTAFAKGLPHRTVITRHVLPGAMLPVVSYLGPATASVLTGSLVLEKIFALPGMGSHFIYAATQRDYTLAMGMVLTYTVILFIMNSLVDISYSIIDPRVKLQ